MKKNKNFITAFENVKLTKYEKEEIYKNILNHSSRKKIFYMNIFRTCCLGVFTTFLFFLYNTNIQEAPSNRTRIMPITSFHDQIIFDGKCYKEKNIEEIEIGNYLGMVEKENMTSLLYAHKKDDSIVFLFKEGIYIPYEEIVCK